MERTILHCDMNAFYASVEIMQQPSLRGKAVAVCGSTETRHGIVLAKSALAKRAGVQTGMANWEAKKLCPHLIIVPPHYEQYLKYSRLARRLYEGVTDFVEPYGMDECFLDVTTLARSTSGERIAHSIRKRIQEELGLTISVGVSYNKILAKLGSDQAAPNSVVLLPKEVLTTRIWPLPVRKLLFVGAATEQKLHRYAIRTIGELAQSEPALLQRILGKQGLKLQQYALGRDTSPVMHKDVVSPIKSIGHGITCQADLENELDVWRVMVALSQDIGHKLRVHKLRARGVQISIRHKDLCIQQKQGQLTLASRVPLDLATKGRQLFQELLAAKAHVLPARAVTLRAISLVDEREPYLDDLFTDYETARKKERLYDTVDTLRARFGKQIIQEALLLEEDKMPEYRDYEVILPGKI